MNNGRSGSDLACVGFDHFCFGMFGVMLFRVLVHDVLGIAQSSGVFGTFVGSIGCEFGAIGGAVFLDFFCFSFREFGFRCSLVFGGIAMFFLLPLFFLGFFVLRKFGFASGVNFRGFIVFFEFGAADESIGLDVIGGFLVFRLDELGRKGHDLVFAQFDIAARGLGF